MIRKTIISITLALLTCTAAVTAKEYKAVVFGVKADGVTNNTSSIQRAIDYISKQGGGTLVFYVGRYVTGSFQLKSNVNIKISGGAVLVFSPNAFDVEGVDGMNAMMYGDAVENVHIYGGGTFEGSAQTLNASIEAQAAKGHIADAGKFKPSIIALKNCKNIELSTFYLQNAPSTTMTLKDCENISIKDFYIFNRDVPATGFNISGCKNVTVDNTYFDTNTTVASDGTSSGLSFKGCRTSKGETVEVSK